MTDKLDKLYEEFFRENSIDNKSGIVQGTNRRFATKIAIGDNYKSSQTKLLFVSLDMGKDECFKENRFQNYEERKNNALNEDLNKNPHMAGVYGTALFFLKNQNKWEDEWQKYSQSNKFFKEAIKDNIDILPKNVLSYISLINFYSFVTVGRGCEMDERGQKIGKKEERTGGSDRIFINRQSEINLLVEIINTVKPNVIVVQSQTLRKCFRDEIKPKINYDLDIYIGYHPSVFGRGIKYRNPNIYMESLLKGKLI
jgi:hypothetical protein